MSQICASSHDSFLRAYFAYCVGLELALELARGSRHGVARVEVEMRVKKTATSCVSKPSRELVALFRFLVSAEARTQVQRPDADEDSHLDQCINAL